MANQVTVDESGPVYTSINQKLSAALKPVEISVVNDSWQHRHHAAMRAQGGSNGETHFSINIVSEAFEGKTTIQRHRMIYDLLGEELQQGLHALSLRTKTPTEVRNLPPISTSS
ncbi:BolA domain UV induced protein Uvi31 [Paramarasmius palmivorus]|uniref:BolA domain UV induced protein Uvi31 n=1 Tax=Paramarasmius palmivorus TaxID=297713 RepID=A0AAW0DL16_9AGAR